MRHRHWLPYIDEFPPALCRLLARKRRGTVLMSTREIARVSGLSRSTVDKLGKALHWASITNEQTHRFSLACGVNLFDADCRRRQREFFLRRKCHHLRMASKAQQAMADRLFRLLSGRAKRGWSRSPTGEAPPSAGAATVQT